MTLSKNPLTHMSKVVHIVQMYGGSYKRIDYHTKSGEVTLSITGASMSDDTVNHMNIYATMFGGSLSDKRDRFDPSNSKVTITIPKKSLVIPS